MNATNDPSKFITGIFAAGQDFMRQLTAAPPASGAAPASASDPMAQFVAASKHFSEMQRATLEQLSNYWTTLAASGTLFPLPGAGAAGTVTAKSEEDRRFAAEAWKNDARFDLIRRSYVAYAAFLEDSVERAGLSPEMKGQMQFAVKQFIDAMSPANFFLTNPEAAHLAIETGGKSVIDGMTLFFQDLAKGRISMTDESKFAVGKNLAVTPGSVIFENELIQLIQYTPTTPKVRTRPLVIIPPCVNKFYILDLQPENSFVRYAVAEGLTVFIVSWRSITPALGHLTWDDYLTQGVMRAIDVALEITGADKVNALGFCIGGTLLASALAVMATNGEEKAASVTLLTTLLEFTETGELGLLVTPESVAQREAAIGRGGVFQGRELASVFSSLRANDLIWQYVVNSYLKGKAPPAFDMLYWNSDSTDLAGPMVTWFVRNGYLENNFKKPGKTIQCGTPVDLNDVKIPAFVYGSREDHIVPWHTAYRSGQLLGGPRTFVLGASGHIAGVINAPAKKKRNYWTNGIDSKEPDHWLGTAQSVPGSWWSRWREWLGAFAGPEIEAPAQPGNGAHAVIESAPGRYVMAKSA